MATHSNILVWKIPWTEEPGGLQSMGLQRVRHDWVTSISEVVLFVAFIATLALCCCWMHRPLLQICSSDCKVCACNAGDLGSIPGLGISSWRRKWQPTPVLLPGKFHGWRNLVGYSPWGHKESDTTEQLHWWNTYRSVSLFQFRSTSGVCNPGT